MLSDLLSEGIDYVTQLTSDFLVYLQVSEWLRSLLIDGVFAGVGSVLSFPADNCNPIFPAVYIGGQRIYGTCCVCYG